MIKKDREQERLTAEEQDMLDESKKAFLIESPRWSNLLLYGIAAVITTLLIWAKFAIIDEYTRADGKVIPSSQVQVIQNLEGGILSEIFVHEGDTVQKGQVLIRIDDTRFASDFREGQSKYLSLLASTARLKAEEQGQKKVTYPKVVMQEAPDVVIDEDNLFKQRQQQLDASLSTLKRSYNLVKEELDITKPLVEEGLMSQLELIRLQRDVNEIKGKIDQAREEFESRAHEEYNKQQAQLSQLVEALNAMKDRMVRTTVRSPVKGTVKKINIATIGGVIRPGMDIMEIVPLEDTLLIEAKVRPKDIAFIHPGQAAMVKFTAYDYSIYGGLHGVVEYISADTIQDDEQQGAKKESFYKILVRTQTNHLGSTTKPLPIIPGMVCSVDILTGKKSVLDYLLKPILKAKQNALRER